MVEIEKERKNPRLPRVDAAASRLKRPPKPGPVEDIYEGENVIETLRVYRYIDHPITEPYPSSQEIVSVAAGC